MSVKTTFEQNVDLDAKIVLAAVQRLVRYSSRSFVTLICQNVCPYPINPLTKRTMTQEEQYAGNKEIAILDGYVQDLESPIYKHTSLPNMFLGEFAYHSDWNRLISVHNKARKLFFTLDKPTQKRFLQSEDTYIERSGFVSFFSTFENQYTISSCWNKMVDFAKWYNSQPK